MRGIKFKRPATHYDYVLNTGMGVRPFLADSKPWAVEPLKEDTGGQTDKCTDDERTAGRTDD